MEIHLVMIRVSVCAVDIFYNVQRIIVQEHIILFVLTFSDLCRYDELAVRII